METQTLSRKISYRMITQTAQQAIQAITRRFSSSAHSRLKQNNQKTNLLVYYTDYLETRARPLISVPRHFMHVIRSLKVGVFIKDPLLAITSTSTVPISKSKLITYTLFPLLKPPSGCLNTIKKPSTVPSRSWTISLKPNCRCSLVSNTASPYM